MLLRAVTNAILGSLTLKLIKSHPPWWLNALAEPPRKRWSEAALSLS